MNTNEMTRQQQEDFFEKTLKKMKGVTEVESYTLVNNYGWTFKKKGERYDIRFWANCYGVYLGTYNIWPYGRTVISNTLKTTASNVNDLLKTIEAL